MKTKDYRTTHLQSGAFMTPKTFVKWVLSWISSLRIDYRQEIDPECRHDPRMLVSSSSATFFFIFIEKETNISLDLFMSRLATEPTSG